MLLIIVNKQTGHETHLVLCYCSLSFLFVGLDRAQNTKGMKCTRTTNQ